jgi:ABC-type Mn2+/Zn2+ transport system ATPase subunit
MIKQNKMYKFDLKIPAFLPQSGCEICFELLQGSSLVIVGENGIGKSTLLNHFLQKFESSSVAFAEQKPLDFFYDYSLAQIRELQSGIDTFWADFDLSQKGDRRISMLSGGEAQSLKLASALASPKELYVLDEPSQALDHDKKKNLSRIIQKLMGEGKTFLIVEHDTNWLPKDLPVIKLGQADGVIKVVDQWTT